jgi:SAM-dependent methyltransferase
MKEYYSKRASEYESIYYRNDPVRQSEQSKIKDLLKVLFQNRTVLDIACGTGYWTEVIASVAREVTGIDASSEVLEIAKSKGVAAKFVLGNAYDLSTVEGEFDSSCANFWFSHIEKVNIPKFLTALHQRLPDGSIIFMADNVYVPGLGGTLVEKPNSPDTYKLRELSDGSTYEIVKNYYTRDTLKTIFKDFSDDLHIEFGQCFWWLTYKTKKPYLG